MCVGGRHIDCDSDYFFLNLFIEQKMKMKKKKQSQRRIGKELPILHCAHYVPMYVHYYSRDRRTFWNNFICIFDTLQTRRAGGQYIEGEINRKY